MYVDALEQLLAGINASTDRDYRIASGGGRMTITMDRYERRLAHGRARLADPRARRGRAVSERARGDRDLPRRAARA